MKVSPKGQVTIPMALREQFGLLPDTEVEFRAEPDGIKIVRVPGEARGRAIIAHLTGRGTVKLTTDEIMALTRGEP